MMLQKKQIRYWCFRFKTEVEGGAPAEGAPSGLREHFEGNSFFNLVKGWVGFASEWDIEMKDGNPEIKPIDKSIWKDWDEHCKSIAKSIPKKKKNVKKVDRPDFTESETVDVYLKKD